MLKYHLFKFLQALIFPPGIFVLFLFFASLFAKRFKKFFLFLTIVAYIFSTKFMGNLLLEPLEKPYKVQSFDKKASLVVVLGAGYYEGSPNLPLSYAALKRAIYGYKLAKKTNLPLLYNGTDKESKNAQKTYLEIFEDDSFIYYENRALNTKENAIYTKQYIKKHNLSHYIYLVTSASHMQRALKEFQNQGIKVLPSATDFMVKNELCFCNFYPTVDGLRQCYTALHEYLALLVEYVKK